MPLMKFMAEFRIESHFIQVFPIPFFKPSPSQQEWNAPKYSMKMDKAKKLYSPTFRLHLKISFPLFSLIHDFI